METPRLIFLWYRVCEHEVVVFDIVVVDVVIGVTYASFDCYTDLARSDLGYVGNLNQDRLDLCLASNSEVECVACPTLDEHIYGFRVIFGLRLCM